MPQTQDVATRFEASAPEGIMTPAHGRQAARQRQETPEFRAQYALRAGVESSLSQGVRRFALRQSRSIGLVRTHLQQVLTATAMHVVCMLDWLRGQPLGKDT